MVPVPNRTKEELLMIIEKWISPGTIIISDCWKAYDCLGDKEFFHFKINHSIEFVDYSERSILMHTQGIERAWRDLTSYIPKYGVKAINYNGHLSMFLFKRMVNHSRRNPVFFEFLGKDR